jgi:hypothetical protein
MYLSGLEPDLFFFSGDAFDDLTKILNTEVLDIVF